MAALVKGDRPLHCLRPASAERERERLHAGIEELDLELSIDDRLRLSDQLIQPLFDHRAVAALVHVARREQAPGGCPSIDTRKRTEVPCRGGPMTR